MAVAPVLPPSVCPLQDYRVQFHGGITVPAFARAYGPAAAVLNAGSWIGFHESFQGLYNMYYSQYGTNQTQSTSGGGSSSGVSRDPYARLLHGLNQHKKKKSRGDPTMSSEYEQYLKTDFVSGLQPKDFASYDVLGFWKSKENQFPVLSRESHPNGMDI
ncbi:hypothetical protein Tco_0977325 [Tanacetum coccineum]|uniref:Uncharacterized protein n=1 Tax=Tanacetum coccineum TaxID=301880 RepID=A0ABQ5EJS6_9ASTR